MLGWIIRETLGWFIPTWKILPTYFFLNRAILGALIFCPVLLANIQLVIFFSGWPSILFFRLAGFFPIHKYGGRENACGEIQKEDGIQPLEAMLYILDEINRNPNVLPNITLGAIAVDSCDNPIRASNLSLPLLKGFLKRNGILESPPCQGLKNNDNDDLSCDNIF